MSLTSSSRVYTQAIRNLNDGLSVIGIANGALRELSSIVTRYTELAEQSANGVYSSKQRQAIDEEGKALAAEYTRVVSTTRFNNVNVLGAGGQQSSIALQGGYGSDSIHFLNIGSKLGDVA